MQQALKIGTRESQLAVWQASLVQRLLSDQGIKSELEYIKSEGDINLVTPLYEIGVQGIFTKTLDAALLSNRIDIAVHSMKDVPVQLAKGITIAAVLPRASYKDILVYKEDASFLKDKAGQAIIATSSIRRKAQWLQRYPHHSIENLRGNVNTRLQKLKDSNWNGAIFAAAGVERIGLRPATSIDLDWMLPAPAQGAIVVVCREDDLVAKKICTPLHDENTFICTTAERNFLKTLKGGCSTPISALATIENNHIHFKGQVCSTDGRQSLFIEQSAPKSAASHVGYEAATELITKGADKIIQAFNNGKN